jgi:GtrA-like protein
MLDQLSLKPNGIDHRIVGLVHEPVNSDTATIRRIIIPTFNDRENVEPLLASLAAALVGLSFRASQIVATLVAMTSNFFLHNQFTYRDGRLRASASCGGSAFSIWSAASVSSPRSA